MLRTVYSGTTTYLRFEFLFFPKLQQNLTTFYLVDCLFCDRTLAMIRWICLTLFLLFPVLYKHMDGVTNDVERSNEMVSFIVVSTAYFSLAAFTGH